MDNEKNIQLLIDGAKTFGVDINRETAGKFMSFAGMLIEWNSKFNLTSITDMRDIIIKHFLDSLSIFPDVCDINGKMIDIGAGAGFPGIPVGLVCESARILLVDSMGKKVDFMNEAVNHLGLKHISALKARAEELGREKEHREIYGAVFARAVSSLPVLIEYCLPFLRIGGLFIAMKGSCADEIIQSKKALKELGGELEEARSILLPSSDIERTIIRIRKIKQCSTKYPRNTGKPTKSPLI